MYIKFPMQILEQLITKCPYGMTVGVRFLGEICMPQSAQLLGIKVPPKIDSANFSDSKYLQCG